MTGVALERTTLHPMPRWGAAFREQLAVTGLALWREGVVLTVVTVALMSIPIHTAAVWVSMGARPSVSVVGDEFADVSVFPSGLTVLLAVAALFAADGVWRGTESRPPGYFASMPLPDARHRLLKVACGWMWTMAGVLVAQLVIAATIVTVRWIVRDVPGAIVAFPGAEGGPWRWAVPFVAATILYAIGSAVRLAEWRLWRTLGVTLLLLWTIGSVPAMWFGSDAVLTRSILSSRLGLTAAVTGTESVERSVRVRSARMVDAVAGSRLPESSTNVSMRISVAAPNLARWLGAASLWLALSLAAVALAARRRN